MFYCSYTASLTITTSLHLALFQTRNLVTKASSSYCFAPSRNIIHQPNVTPTLDVIPCLATQIVLQIATPAMASDSGARAVNGNYGSINSYGSGDQPLSSHGLGAGSGVPASGSTGAETAGAPNPSTGNSATPAEGSSSVPKDEVGWYFVEQYYTTLSKNPEKLHVSLRPARRSGPIIGSYFSSCSTISVPNSFPESKPKRFLYLLDNVYVYVRP